MRTHAAADHRPGRWLMPLLAGAVLGPAVQVQQASLWPWFAYAAMLCAGIALLASRRARARFVPVAAAAALVAFGAAGCRADAFVAQGLDPALEGRDLAVTGIVAAMPQVSEAGIRFRFDVESAEADGEPQRVPPQLSLGWYAGPLPTEAELLEIERAPAELHPGERWRFTLRLKAPHGAVNPHGFDYELWLWEQGLQATGWVRAGPRDPPPQRLAVTWRHPVERARQQVRDAILRQVEDRATAGVLAALVTGDQNAIERPDWDVFRATGVAHLMSISGLHITMFAWAAALAVGAAWRRSARLCLAWPAQHAALLGGAALAAGYALFSGWGVPAQRTVWMVATVALLRLAGRRWPWPAVWLLAAAVVVTIDPWSLLQAGFWLSFVAVGVLFATDPGRRAIDSEASPGWRAAVVRSAANGVREQWVVTLALTPLTLLLFGQASLVGLVANAIAIPWVTLVVTPLAIAGVLASPLWTVAAGAVQLLQAFVQWLASWPFATIAVPQAPLWAGIAGVLGGLVLTLRLPWPVRALGLPLLLPVALWQAPRPPAGEFELLAADVGQGNAVLVRTTGHTLVYDSGPRYGPDSDAGSRVLVPLLRALGERVDVLLVSHRDTDHTGGAAAVLAQQPRAALLSSLETGHELLALRGGERCADGRHWEWDGVAFDLLHPAIDDYDIARKPNAMSCVLRVSNGTRTALLVGDIEQPQEAALLERSLALLPADVLLVPHHGSKTSSSADFLDAVHPPLALVQAGYRNRFGHPAAPVMARYADRGIAVFASARCGAATWRSDRARAVRCEREAAPHYWLHRVP
jgi:competence protein ComEC